MYERARDYGESALSAIGLQPQRTVSDYILPALGLVGVGMLIGVGLGLMLAPKAGVELRADLGRRVRSVRRRRNQDSLDSQEQGANDEQSEDDLLSPVPTAR